MITRNRQRGATLLVGLIMLVVLTLLAVSAIRSSNTNLRIVGNMQMREEAAAAAQQAIEQVISSASLTVPTPQTVDVNGKAYAVTVSTPVCLSKRIFTQAEVEQLSAAGNDSCVVDAGSPLSCVKTVWDIQATATDSSSGAYIELHQGISVSMSSAVGTAACL